MENSFYGKVQRVIPVSTVNDSNLMLFGIRFVGEEDWLRVCTTNIEMAEAIAFLSPGEDVKIAVNNTVTLSKTDYREIVSVVHGAAERYRLNPREAEQVATASADLAQGLNSWYELDAKYKAKKTRMNRWSCAVTTLVFGYMAYTTTGNSAVWIGVGFLELFVLLHWFVYDVLNKVK